MTIRTWGDFELGIIRTMSNYAKEVGKRNKLDETQIEALKSEFFSGIQKSIETYYEKMKNNELGEPNQENFNTMLTTFWNEFKHCDMFSYITDVDMEVYENVLEIDKSKFTETVKQTVLQSQHLAYKENLGIEDIACFRFATDGRTTETGFTNIDQQSLQDLGSLAAVCADMGVRNSDDMTEMYTDGVQVLRKNIEKELQNHANRQVKQKMSGDIQVYLCGGYGEPYDGEDMGKGQSLPEHMWLEIKDTKTGKIIASIDTFPNQAVRIAPGYEGPPSEPFRIGMDNENRIVKLPIDGIPEGIQAALIHGKTQIKEINDETELDNVKEENQYVYVNPEGEIQTGQQAVEDYRYEVSGQEITMVESMEDMPASRSIGY